MSLNTFQTPDLKVIAESGAHDDTARLIQLILGVAINCEHKDGKWLIVAGKISVLDCLYL